MTPKKLLVASLIGCALASPAWAANIVLNNVDPAGVGFNDPTPATPVGGNAGTTVGAQRLIAYKRALELWGKTLASNVTIVVQGSFAGLPCTPTGGTLAQAGANQIFSDFPNAPLKGHWYGSALANSLAGYDLAPGAPDVPGPTDQYNDDIVANFNGNIGKPDCIAGPGWYYGLDNQAPAGQTDFLDTFMHEVAHGLGFQNFATEATGATIEGLPDVYMAYTRDLTTGKQWNMMNAAEIRASAIRNGQVVWSGAKVTAAAPLVLGPYQGIRLTGTLSKELEFGTASFGAAPDATNFKGAIVVGNDSTGSSLGCVAPLTSAVAGKVALMDRGVCGFAVKAKNAQLAGATAVIIANNAGGAAIPLGGTDVTVTVPTIGISAADGAAIKAALPGVNVEFFSDASRLAGTTDGLVRLYAPTAVIPGSSISHYDVVASPNLLMEPSITTDLRSARNLDLTPALMQDIGWQIETLKIGACDSGVPAVLANGELLHASVDSCKAGAKNQGQFVSCMNKVTNDAKTRGWISGSQHAGITSCTARGTP
ncbi:MAG TPA: PA domain-containing protein [Burkholderiaceae bacterium]